MSRKIKVIILAGGKGERLRPLTNTIPKPMIAINGKPLLSYIVAHFVRSGFKNIILSICYLPEKIVKYFDDGKKFGASISYSFEDQKKPLGTAGAVSLLKKKLNDTFIVCYGDTIRDINLRKMLTEHESQKGIGTIYAHENKNPNPKSIITINDNNLITSFVERPKKKYSSPVWSNGGLYILEPKVFPYIPQNSPSDFGKDILPTLVKNNERLYVYRQRGYFLDMGNIDKVKKLENDIKKRLVKL